MDHVAKVQKVRCSGLLPLLADVTMARGALWRRDKYRACTPAAFGVHCAAQGSRLCTGIWQVRPLPFGKSAARPRSALRFYFRKGRCANPRQCFRGGNQGFARADRVFAFKAFGQVGSVWPLAWSIRYGPLGFGSSPSCRRFAAIGFCSCRAAVWTSCKSLRAKHIGPRVFNAGVSSAKQHCPRAPCLPAPSGAGKTNVGDARLPPMLCSTPKQTWRDPPGAHPGGLLVFLPQLGLV